MAYENLLSPGKIGSLTIKNRIVLSAMGTDFANHDGSCNERMLNYYEARAAGGCGFIVFETGAASWPSGVATPGMIGYSEDRFIPGLKAIVDVVHKYGTKIAAQLNHCGKGSREDIAAGRPVLVPSMPKKLEGNLMRALTPSELRSFAVFAGPDGKGPKYKAMDADDIKQTITDYADSAVRAEKAGFDAIEIHAGHGYMLSGFLSPFANDRTDEYGGTALNRARLLCEIIAAIKSKTDNRLPVIVRLDAHEYRIEGGTRIEDAIIHAQAAVEAGADCIDVSAYGNGLSGIAFTEAPLVHEPGGLLKFAHRIKQAVDVPVIAVGRVSPEEADREIEQGNFDFLAMGRKLLADPDLPNKLLTAPKQIRPCIYCYVCVSKIFLCEPTVCAVNPALGREIELDDGRPCEKKKNILIVGAGPAGLEAGRVLALRGHQVTIHEKANRLGGTARIAALPYAPNEDLVTWLTHEVERLPISINLNSELSVQDIANSSADHVVLAVGATRSAPPMHGKNQSHVFDGDELRGILFGDNPQALRKLPWWQRIVVGSGRISGLLNSISLLRRLSKVWMPLGKRVVLIGGGLVGLELAEYLCERGREVTILEPGTHMGKELSVVRRARVLHLLRKDGVKLITRANVVEIHKGHVEYTREEEVHMAEADSVIISLGADKNPSLGEALSKRGIQYSEIGDGREVGYIEGAMRSARELAVQL